MKTDNYVQQLNEVAQRAKGGEMEDLKKPTKHKVSDEMTRLKARMADLVELLNILESRLNNCLTSTRQIVIRTAIRSRRLITCKANRKQLAYSI